MDWYKLFKFASGYGSWLSPSGQPLEVPFMGHEKEGWNILQKQHGFKEMPDSIWTEMFGLGYVRLNYQPFTVTYHSLSNFTGAQKRAMAEMIRGKRDESRFEFYNISSHEEKNCTDYLCAIEAVRKL
jgi:hypothetical protein